MNKLIQKARTDTLIRIYGEHLQMCSMYSVKAEIKKAQKEYSIAIECWDEIMGRLKYYPELLEQNNG